MDDREYQETCIETVRRLWGRGTLSVVVVGPPGAGKTYIGARLGEGMTGLWVAHHRELVYQAERDLKRIVGEDNVGLIMSKEVPRPHAEWQVASIGTLLQCRPKLTADLIVLDEAHHYAADMWREVALGHDARLTLGLTATPERYDGRPLDDIFDDFVVAATYAELRSSGVLVPWQVIRPDAPLGMHLAMDVVEAWRLYSGGQQTIVFEPSVDIADADKERFIERGVSAACITYDMPTRERDQMMEAYRRGDIRVLTCYRTILEGLDVPEASVIVLARNIDYTGTFLQAAGRGARRADAKDKAVLLDLTGASHVHGFPDIERSYSLSGRAISRPRFELDKKRGRRRWTQRIAGVPLEVAEGSCTRVLPPPVQHMHDRHGAVAVDEVVREITARSGRTAADLMRRFYGGLSE